MKEFHSILLYILFFLIPNLGFSQILHTSYKPEDVLAFPRISQVVPADNGIEVTWSTFEIKSTTAGKRWEYSLYLKKKSGQIILLDKNNIIFSVTWSPDNKKIGYLAKGNKFVSIWIEDLVIHKKIKLIEFSNDIEAFKWSPNGKDIVFVAHNELKPSTKFLTPIDVSKNYNNLGLYRISANLNSNMHNNVELLTSSNISISLGFLDNGFDWAPNGRTIAFSFQPRTGAAYLNESKIGILDLQTHQTKNIPYTDNHTGKQPLFSPDGKWIAFRSNLTPSKIAPDLTNNILINDRVCLIDVTTLKTICLANTFNESPFLVGWNQSSDHIFILDFYESNGLNIYSLSLDPSVSPTLTSNVDGFIEPLTFNLNNSHTHFGFGYETTSQAPEVFVSMTQPFKLNQITHLQYGSSNIFGKVEKINWKSSDGMKIEGLLTTPADYKPNKKYPMYVAVHGGPYGVWSKRFLGGCDEYGQMIDPTTCWQNLLSLGFVIFQPNPRGSTGYGLKFRSSNFADLGGGDYRDIMSGVHYLIEKGVADPNHLAIAGWSYGGYMTVWAISHTNQFKAAIEGDGNTNLISYSGTSDLPWLWSNYLGNAFWNNNTLYIQRSPIFYVKNITTPLLIINGQIDIRNPSTQSYELYTSLQQQHKQVKMLILPNQEHLPIDANIIFETIKDVDDWLKKAL